MRLLRKHGKYPGFPPPGDHCINVESLQHAQHIKVLYSPRAWRQQVIRAADFVYRAVFAKISVQQCIESQPMSYAYHCGNNSSHRMRRRLLLYNKNLQHVVDVLVAYQAAQPVCDFEWLGFFLQILKPYNE